MKKKKITNRCEDVFSPSFFFLVIFLFIYLNFQCTNDKFTLNFAGNFGNSLFLRVFFFFLSIVKMSGGEVKIWCCVQSLDFEGTDSGSQTSRIFVKNFRENLNKQKVRLRTKFIKMGSLFAWWKNLLDCLIGCVLWHINLCGLFNADSGLYIALVAQISLTLSRHSSLSFIALGRSSGQHPVSSHSCWMYVRAGRPAFARPCVGIHKSTSLMSSSLLLQQCPACLVRLTWIVFVIGGRWPYSWRLVGCCCQMCVCV